MPDRFYCPNCNDKFTKWNICLDHLRQTNHLDPKNISIEKCRINISKKVMRERQGVFLNEVSSINLDDLKKIKKSGSEITINNSDKEKENNNNNNNNNTIKASEVSNINNNTLITMISSKSNSGGGSNSNSIVQDFETLIAPPTLSDVIKLNSTTFEELEENNDDNELDLDDNFLQKANNKNRRQLGFIACNQKHRDLFEESALLGEIKKYRSKLYLNTHEPFSIFLVGVQGSGKSHSLACLLESCLLAPDDHKLIKLNQPLSTLVFHYDNNIASVCEVTGLITTSSPSIEKLKKFNINPEKYHLDRNNMIVLVSPSYYQQRKSFYGDHCKVYPLLFKWKSITADHIKILMAIANGDNQLYVAVLLDLLRKYQRLNCLPTFSSFTDEVIEKCGLKSQQGPLSQRLALLQSIIAESEINKDLIDISCDLSTAIKPGMLVVVDLTDPLLSRNEANSIFEVLTEQYRAIPANISGGKVLALDEAHKFMSGTGDRLSTAIVNCARLMRHDDMRLIISTQSPLSLAPELLELASMAILHRFYSNDWFDHLSRKIPLSPELRTTIADLDPGNALVFAPRHRLNDSNNNDNDGFFEVAIRSRLTADYGASKTNALI